MQITFDEHFPKYFTSVYICMKLRLLYTELSVTKNLSLEATREKYEVKNV